MIQQYGSFQDNPKFWRSIDPMAYIPEITIPIQIQHSVTDEEVPYILGQKLDEALVKANKNVQFYSYEGDNHNISNNLGTALDRSVAFFDMYLKGGK